MTNQVEFTELVDLYQFVTDSGLRFLNPLFQKMMNAACIAGSKKTSFVFVFAQADDAFLCMSEVNTKGCSIPYTVKFGADQCQVYTNKSLECPVTYVAQKPNLFFDVEFDNRNQTHEYTTVNMCTKQVQTHKTLRGIYQTCLDSIVQPVVGCKGGVREFEQLEAAGFPFKVSNPITTSLVAHQKVYTFPKFDGRHNSLEQKEFYRSKDFVVQEFSCPPLTPHEKELFTMNGFRRGVDRRSWFKVARNPITGVDIPLTSDRIYSFDRRPMSVRKQVQVVHRVNQAEMKNPTQIYGFPASKLNVTIANLRGVKKFVCRGRILTQEDRVRAKFQHYLLRDLVDDTPLYASRYIDMTYLDRHPKIKCWQLGKIKKIGKERLRIGGFYNLRQGSTPGTPQHELAQEVIRAHLKHSRRVLSKARRLRLKRKEWEMTAASSIYDSENN